MSDDSDQHSEPNVTGPHPGPELLYATRRFVEGQPGTLSNVRIEVPNLHPVLWGQRLSSFARATGFVSPPFSEYLIEGIAAVSHFVWDGSERTLNTPADGDSFLTISPDYEYKIQASNGDVHDVRFIANRHNRFAGFQIGPLGAPSADDAAELGEIIANGLQRAAALANVELHFPIVRASRPDRKEIVQSIAMPYPIVELPAPLEPLYPVVALLVTTLAEGRRSASVFYRALVFFKIVEAFVEKIQPALNKTQHQHGIPTEKFDLRLPQDPFQRISPKVVGLSYTDYRLRVQDRIRNVVSHLDPSSPIVPFSLDAEREVRTASIVLHFIATEIVGRVDQTVRILASKDSAAAKAFRYEGVDKRRRRTMKKP